MTKAEKRRLVMKVLQEAWEQHRDTALSNGQAALEFAGELMKYIECGRLSKATREYVEFEIKHNLGMYEPDPDEAWVAGALSVQEKRVGQQARILERAHRRAGRSKLVFK